MMHPARLAGWPALAAAAVLVCLVGVLFFSVLGFPFVELDVGDQVLRNPDVHGLSAENLKHIFTSRGLAGSYYPVRALSHAIDYQLWGTSPAGFKLTGVLIRTANVLAVFWLVLRIARLRGSRGSRRNAWWDVSVATFSAGLFAIHPVVVEPVTWVAGRQELLMTLRTLGSVFVAPGAVGSSPALASPGGKAGQAGHGTRSGEVGCHGQLARPCNRTRTAKAGESHESPGRFQRSRLPAVGAMGVGVLALLVLDLRSIDQVGTWHDNVTLWKHCLRVAPGNVVAWRGLADGLASAGRFDQAIPYYQTALRMDPDSKETLNNYAYQLATDADPTLRNYGLAIRLAERGCRRTGWKEQRLRRTLAIACNHYALELDSRGQFRPAVRYYEKGLDADPQYELLLCNFAILLATCPDQKLRSPPLAVELAERACRLAGDPVPADFSVLAAAYASAGRLDAATWAIERAVRLAEASGDQESVGRLQRQLEDYREQSKRHRTP